MELIGENSYLAHKLKSIIERGRRSVAAAVNHELALSCWRIGKAIADKELNNYDGQGERSFSLALSKALIKEIGQGFSRADLISMKTFYKSYPKRCPDISAGGIIGSFWRFLTKRPKLLRKGAPLGRLVGRRAPAPDRGRAASTGPALVGRLE